VLTGDTWEGAGGLYDVIFAVPPYVPPQMKDEVMQELGAEDPLSFFDKEDGYYYHKQVLSQAKNFLKDDGALYLEFDITQREKIEALAKEYGFENYSFLKDPYDHECVIKLAK
jgi:release factor glutamine methyltransferase